eukprot:scaffold228976_cov15-Tisochrysis_lutea.AAC.1
MTRELQEAWKNPVRESSGYVFRDFYALFQEPLILAGIVHTRPQLKRIDIISWRGRVFDLRDPLLILLSRKFEPEGAK